MRWLALILATLVALGLRALTGMWPGIALVFDPLLVVSALAALPGRPWLALVAGLLTGAIEDAWSGGWYGQNAFTHVVTAYLLALIAQRMDLLGWLPAALVVGVATLADWGLQLGLYTLFDRPFGTVPAAVVWGLAVVANTFAGLLFHRAIYGLGEPRPDRR